MNTLQGEQILYAGNDWVSDNRTSSHHISRRLARSNTLLYIEASGQRSPRFTKRDLRKIFQKILKAFHGPRRIDSNVYLYSPLILPFHRYPLIRRLNRVLLALSLNWACRRVGFREPLIWMAVPHYASIVDSVRARGIVYYCVDEYASLPNTDREATLNMEAHILSKADVVFVISEKLLESKRHLNPNTYLSLHGVETAHFQAATEKRPIPEDIASLPRPVAGFFGLIEEWVDLDLVRHAATRLPNISFVLIGRVARDVTPVASLPNVHFLGQRPYADLPRYLKAFDVGLIPFKLTDVIINSNPLKFKEYLAGGKPVVSVQIAALDPYAQLAYVARSYDEFTEMIQRAIAEDSAEKSAARVQAMAGESWDIKFENICRTVRSCIAPRTA